MPRQWDERSPGFGERSLAADMIEVALDDMKRLRPLKTSSHGLSRPRHRPRGYRAPTVNQDHFGCRVRAAAWLASKGATPWFEAAGLDQKAVLEKTGWVAAASSLLTSIRHRTSDYLALAGIQSHHIRLVRDGVGILGGGTV